MLGSCYLWCFLVHPPVMPPNFQKLYGITHMCDIFSFHLESISSPSTSFPMFHWSLELEPRVCRTGHARFMLSLVLFGASPSHATELSKAVWNYTHVRHI